MNKILAAGLLAMSAPLMIAAAGPEEEAAAAEAAKKTQEEKGGPNASICKKLPPPGSRLGKRQVCKTQAEWDAMEQDMRDGLRESQRKPFSAG